MNGERFYPYDETAAECIDVFEEADDVEVTEFSRGQEYGKHGRAWSEAVEIFDMLFMHGYDPVERTERYVDENDLPELDWSWYDDS